MKLKQDSPEKKITESVHFIHRQTRTHPKIGVILGSGLGEFADRLTDRTVVDTAQIPNYPALTVVGHSGKLVFGKLGKLSVCALQGRAHFYESGILESVIYPVKVLHGLGIKLLVVTNAAGGMNPGFSPGDLMLITDQINLTFRNSLTPGSAAVRNLPLYDEGLCALIRKAAHKASIPLKEGIYCGVLGPSYETAAEIRMAHTMGADAIGMSTVNEVSYAVHAGIRVAGISCITNMSTGIATQKLDHSEVTEVANRVKKSFEGLLEESLHAFGTLPFLR